ncbi:hypothetical protein Tco_0206595 [Tanacetum coccineum]
MRGRGGEVGGGGVQELQQGHDKWYTLMNLSDSVTTIAILHHRLLIRSPQVDGDGEEESISEFDLKMTCKMCN